MTTHSTKHYLDIDRPKYPEAAANILQRHQEFDAEANITSAIRDFLVITGLARASQIVEETPPSSESRCAVDLTALDTFIEVKRRIGSSRGNDPDPQNIAQLDDYLAQSERDGKGVRMGVLTDGKHWILRWRGAGDVRTTYPYAFTLDSPEKWLPLYEWLRDKALVSNVNIHPNADTIEEHFGPKQPNLPTRHRPTAKPLRPTRRRQDRQTQTRTVERPPPRRTRRSRRKRPRTRRPLRPTYLPRRSRRHDSPSIYRHRHLPAGGERPKGLAHRARLPTQDRAAGGRRVGLLHVASRVWRGDDHHGHSTPRRKVRLERCAKRRRIHPLSMRHPVG